jgi:phage baseplate assembly protein W
MRERNLESDDFLGSGWSFSFQEDEWTGQRKGMTLDGRGSLALAHREKDIEEAIYIILMTAKGERVMRPEFGCDIHTLMFHPNNATTAGLAEYYVRDALARWEPRIEVEGVRVIQTEEMGGAVTSSAVMHIDIRYRIKATNDERNLVFPFYLIPTEEE